MSNKIPTKLKWMIAAAVVLAVVLIMLVFRLYPVAVVGGDFVSAKDWKRNYDIAKRLDAEVDKGSIYVQFLRAKQKEQLAQKLKILSDADFEREKLFYLTGKSDEYRDLVDKYFNGDEKLFRDYVITPQTVDAKLNIKYNSDFSTNQDAYNKATSILAKLERGEKFEDLAKEHSDDQLSGAFGGDLGFVGENQLLPELETIVAASQFGEVNKQVIISRLGYHIIYPQETAVQDGQKIRRIKHILIKTQGYDKWRDSQLEQIAVWRLIGI